MKIPSILLVKIPITTGGEGGIRTHGTVSRSQHFQCCQFNHSCTSPGDCCPINFSLSLDLMRLYHERNDKLKLIVHFFWRRGWDSNPRWPLSHSGFRDRCTNPLCDLSALVHVKD